MYGDSQRAFTKAIRGASLDAGMAVWLKIFKGALADRVMESREGSLGSYCALAADLPNVPASRAAWVNRPDFVYFLRIGAAVSASAKERRALAAW